MNIKTYLADYRKKANRFLDRFFTAEEKKAAAIDPFCAQTIRMYREFMHGGKMARGALTVLGYQSAGGKIQKAILAPSAAVEIAHHFLLIHDDWIDGDLVRHQKPTIHKEFEAIHQKRFDKGNSSRWIGGMSFVLGDIGCFLAHKLLADSNFPASRKIRAISLLSENLIKTGYGEVLDITYDLQPGLDWQRIITIRELKTACYTLIMPLVVGLSLAGAKQEKIEAAKKFGLPVGIGFQLRDDYLGLFGDEKITGKSASSDLKEGKKTLIIAKALEFLKGRERKFIENCLGKNITQSDIKKARKIIQASGAVDFCQNLAQKLVTRGKKAIPRLTTDPSLVKIYSSLADYLVTREK